jgi:hypothetical protein
VSCDASPSAWRRSDRSTHRRPQGADQGYRGRDEKLVTGQGALPLSEAGAATRRTRVHRSLRSRPSTRVARDGKRTSSPPVPRVSASPSWRISTRAVPHHRSRPWTRSSRRTAPRSSAPTRQPQAPTLPCCNRSIDRRRTQGHRRWRSLRSSQRADAAHPGNETAQALERGCSGVAQRGGIAQLAKMFPPAPRAPLLRSSSRLGISRAFNQCPSFRPRWRRQMPVGFSVRRCAEETREAHVCRLCRLRAGLLRGNFEPFHNHGAHA